MIFFGQGGLLMRAVRRAHGGGHAIDGVFDTDGTSRDACARLGVPHFCGEELQGQAASLRDVCSDGIGFSLNNPRILRPPILGHGIRFFGVHSGIIPRHRGRPEACVVHALLEGDAEYGATLFELDAGVDSGGVIDVSSFPITDADTFETVMMSALEHCDLAFARNLDRIARGDVTAVAPDLTGSRALTLRDLRGMRERSAEPRFRRAADFGVFRDWLPDAYRALHGD